jgi:hypothetical protein
MMEKKGRDTGCLNTPDDGGSRILEVDNNKSKTVTATIKKKNGNNVNIDNNDNKMIIGERNNNDSEGATKEASAPTALNSSSNQKIISGSEYDNKPNNIETSQYNDTQNTDLIKKSPKGLAFFVDF